MKRVDRIGKVYGMLTVLEQYWEDDAEYCVFKCECGNVITRRVYNFSFGYNQTCGCVKKIKPKIGKRKHPLYLIWVNMLRKCNNPKDSRYKNYGEQGIKVCEKWTNSFNAFCEDMEPRPSIKYNLDRIDGTKDFCPENCRWVTTGEPTTDPQRTKVVIEIEGKEYILRQLSEIYNISISVLHNRYYGLGKRGENILKTKYKKKRGYFKS